MSARRNALYAGLLVAGVAVALPGCGVLRIDVDVYKGPLANEEAVQMEQFAAMAIGAKPLLTALRDRLQWPKDEVRDCARAGDWYRAGYLVEPKRVKPISQTEPAQPRNDECGYDGFVPWGEAPGRVNAVLSLYDDINLRGLERFIKDGSEAVERYQDAMAVFGARAKESNKEAWETIRKRFADPSLEELKSRFVLKDGISELELKNVEKGFKTLKLGYKRLFGLEFHQEEKESDSDLLKEWRVDALYLAYAKFLKTIRDGAETETYEAFEKGLLDRKCAPGTRDCPTTWNACLNALAELKGKKPEDVKVCPDRGSNSRYEILRQRDVLAVHIRILFDKPSGEEAKLFREKVIGFADAFFKARQALRGLWLTSLEALIFVSNSPDFADARGLEVRDSYARLISFLTQHRYLAQTLYAEDAPRPVTENLKRLLEKLSPAWNRDKDKGNKEFDFDSTGESLELALKRHPINVALWLEKADAWFVAVSETDFEEQRGNSTLPPGIENLKWEAKRQYGVVRGPTFRDDKFKQFRNDWSRVSVAASAVGFEGGRLPQGIVTLIEAYLLATARQPLASTEDELADKREWAKVRLRKALVRFSEKVLFIANNDKLLSENRKGIDRYVLVLQAVGNSILIQADELRNRESYKDRQKAAKGRESLAVGLAYSSDPRKVLSDLALAIEGKSDVLATTDADYQTLVGELEQNKGRLERRLSALPTQLSQLEQRRDTASTNLKNVKQLRNRVRLAKLFVDDPPTSGTLPLPAPTASVDLLPTFIAKIKEIVNITDPAPLPDNAWPKLRKEIVAEFEGSIATLREKGKAADAGLLVDAQVGFETIAEDSVRKKSRREAFEGFRAALMAKLDKANKDFNTNWEALDTSKSDLKKFDDLNAQIADIEKTLQQAEANRALATELRHTLAAIKDYREEAVKRVRQKPLPLTARNMIDELLALFERDKAQASKTTQLTHAIKHVSVYPVPMVAPASPTTNPKSSKDVLDDVIAALRHEHIKVVNQLGPGAKRSKDIAAALKVAYEQRAGMAYIRPSGAYLRSSYPATSLQDDPGLGWTNMLGRHGLRTTPIIGPLYNLVTEDRTRATINAEIDKQFWQRINSVRVAGAGNTNYVIAKDDVGNWYVKKYSADPAPIIKSAKSLALFGMGGQFDPDLAAQALQKDGLSDPEKSDKLVRQRKPAAPALQPAFDKRKKSYVTATGELYEAFRKLLEKPQSSKLTTDIKASWKESELTKEFFSPNLETALKLAVDEALQPVSEGLGAIEPDGDRSGVGRAEKIADALTGINGFQGTLQSKVLNRKLVAKAENELEPLENKKTGAEKEFKKAESDREKAEKADSRDENAIIKLERIETEKAMALQDAAMKLEDAKAKVKRAQLAQDAAVSDAAQIVRDFLSVRIDKRLQAVNSYEEGIIVLGGIKTQ